MAKDRLQNNITKSPFKDFFDMAPSLLAIVSFNGYFLHLNAAWESLLGYTIEELKSKPYNDFIHPEDIESTKTDIQQQLNNNNSTCFVNRYRCKNGEYVWLEWIVKLSPDGTHLYAAAKDITQIKIQELQLSILKQKSQNRKSRLQTLLNIIPDIVWVKDTAGTYRNLNMRCEKLFGVKEEEAVGKTDYDITTVEFANKIRNYDLGVIRGGKPKKYEEELTFADGHKELVEAIITPLYDDMGNLNELLGVARDITHRKKNEIELIEAKERAEESNQLKTAFLQNISHEIRTPLNAIIGFAYLLEKPEFSDDERKDFIKIIQNSSTQLLSMVSNILTISLLEKRQEQIHLSSICVNSTIKDTIASFSHTANSQEISILSSLPLNDERSIINTDGTKLIQILSNLIANAIKFTKKGSIEIGYTIKNLYMEFYVKDTGIGIDNKDYDTIFERFVKVSYSGDRIYEGAGLGLSISKGLVELLGGSIRVESKLNEGSTFYFTIPYSPM